MVVRTSRNGWRHAVAGAVLSGALAAGLVAGPGSALAWADPTTEAAAPDDATAAPEMTADQALAVVAANYDTGAGGGQISTLIHKIMKLRQRGFYPSTANRDAIVAALDKRPNQAPLVAALESTLAFQTRQASRGGGGGPVLNPPTIGIGGGGNGAIDPNNGGGINIPLG
ncbi:hypothetical protein [Mycolicibacterium sp.]|uniref:hypothetical protein n=1 Tax=Mycolicibacterium sp. TaxID=2320850 RepID=UPI001A1EC817|nr:hypothetical protein [Mycolicibacterium sp.]MBJ7338970.1 hypothetical protein [Mycolicibacterium sp.]